eukprot:6214226-Pleurochrysis_carterae.AAC.5
MHNLRRCSSSGLSSVLGLKADCKSDMTTKNGKWAGIGHGYRRARNQWQNGNTNGPTCYSTLLVCAAASKRAAARMAYGYAGGMREASFGRCSGHTSTAADSAVHDTAYFAGGLLLA